MRRWRAPDWIVRRQLGGKLVQLGRCGGCATARRVNGSGVELGGSDLVGAVRSEREMAGALLDLVRHLGERTMNRAALPDRCLLVTDRGDQRMREPQTRLVELDDPLSNSSLEGIEHPLPIVVDGRHQLDRRSGERRNLEKDVDRLGWQAGEATAEELVQALGHTQRAARRGSRVRPRELAAQLESEERIAGRRVLHPSELGPREVDPQPVAEQGMDSSEAQRADREPLEPLLQSGTV